MTTPRTDGAERAARKIVQIGSYMCNADYTAKAEAEVSRMAEIIRSETASEVREQVRELREALTNAREDIYRMLGERKFMGSQMFDYIDSVLARTKET